MSKPSSKLAGTAVLTISLLSLQGALWYLQPQPTEKTSPLHRYSVVNIHGGNRKLLDVNFSLESSVDHENQQELVSLISFNIHCAFL